ncbi:MAG: class I SAM-dependent methyltransferase [Kofleriaceae bacterium]
MLVPPMPTFADHFSTIAKSYAAYRPTYPPALAAELAARAPRGTAWDVGCGNGQLSIDLAEHFDHVIATDPAKAQIDAAIPHPRVEYRVSSAEASGLDAQSVDLVVAAQAAHWFVWDAWIAEVERVAKPGALVALVSYGIAILEGDAANAIAARYYHDDVGPFWPKGREHVENGYRDLVMPWPAVEAPAIDMTARWTRDEWLGYASTWSATVALVKTKGDAAVRKLAEDLAAVWPDGEIRTIRWPLAIRLARR